MRASPDMGNQTKCAGRRIGGYAWVGGQGVVRETLKSYIKEGRKGKGSEEREAHAHTRAGTDGGREWRRVMRRQGISELRAAQHTGKTSSDESHMSMMLGGRREGTEKQTDRESEREVSVRACVRAWHTPGGDHPAYVSALAPFFAHSFTHPPFPSTRSRACADAYACVRCSTDDKRLWLCWAMERESTGGSRTFSFCIAVGSGSPARERSSFSMYARNMRSSRLFISISDCGVTGRWPALPPVPPRRRVPVPPQVLSTSLGES